MWFVYIHSYIQVPPWNERDKASSLSIFYSMPADETFTHSLPWWTWWSVQCRRGLWIHSSSSLIPSPGRSCHSSCQLWPWQKCHLLVKKHEFTNTSSYCLQSDTRRVVRQVYCVGELGLIQQYIFFEFHSYKLQQHRCMARYTKWKGVPEMISCSSVLWAWLHTSNMIECEGSPTSFLYLEIWLFYALEKAAATANRWSLAETV